MVQSRLRGNIHDGSAGAGFGIGGREDQPRYASEHDGAERTGAVLVMMDNLYAFGPGTEMPMAEGTAMNATGPKGSTRRTMADDLLTAHRAGRLRATFARASDFYGPEVRGAAMGERVVPNVLAGKKVGLLGALDVPHSLSYMISLCRLAKVLPNMQTTRRRWARSGE